MSQNKKNKSKNLEQAGELLRAARILTNHSKYIIAGSLSVLPNDLAPDAMRISPDLDLYPLDDPDRAGEIARAFGPQSPFAKKTGMYADAISPSLLTLPQGWQERLIAVDHGGVTGYYLDPNDAAISKLSRGADNDLMWIEIGLTHKVLSENEITKRLNTTDFLDQNEHEMVRNKWKNLLTAHSLLTAKSFKV